MEVVNKYKMLRGKRFDQTERVHVIFQKPLLTGVTKTRCGKLPTMSRVRWSLKVKTYIKHDSNVVFFNVLMFNWVRIWKWSFSLTIKLCSGNNIWYTLLYAKLIHLRNIKLLESLSSFMSFHNIQSKWRWIWQSLLRKFLHAMYMHVECLLSMNLALKEYRISWITFLAILTRWKGFYFCVHFHCIIRTLSIEK